ncbi:MAG: Holliday junction branch migration protein RuvA [Bifidobacterium sp.]|jgi:Holliday junction DNA helicase RuvA|nr:Holliday junction branch migration protein RuvA [Bifidobacterium sp.]MCI1864538.1 Holliday junction branch migration protein RuvA [Bifidobacterium sp.]
MIGTITGTVEFVQSDSAVIEVAGIGYEIRMPAADLSSLHAGERARVHTSLNVSQDAITLYGFLTSAAKRMFIQLQKVSGIGPRVALSLLSTLTPERLAQCVANGDATALATAPGLGRKGAQKIILELKGSIDLEAADRSGEGDAPQDEGTHQVVEGLMSLGWRQSDAEGAVRTVCESNHLDAPLRPDDVPKVLRLSLAALDKGRHV